MYLGKKGLLIWESQKNYFSRKHSAESSAGKGFLAPFSTPQKKLYLVYIEQYLNS